MFYTVQSIKKWKYAKDISYLEGEKEYIPDLNFRKVYYWMMQQMKKRLFKYNGEYPIWLWTKKSDAIIQGKDFVLLQVNIPEKDVLLSNTAAYQMILNDLPLILNDNEYQLIEEGAMTNEQSWERVFNLKLLSVNKQYKDAKIQGVTGRIDLRNIREINLR